jgi:hypothetical protein
VCGVGSAHEQPLQIDERGQINLRRTYDHPGANHRIEHPTSDRDYDARRSLHLKAAARRSLLHSPHADLAAKIGMPPVINFQLLTDMGRMNG